MIPKAPTVVLLALAMVSALLPAVAGEEPAWIDPDLQDRTGQVSVIVSLEGPPTPELIDQVQALGTILDTYTVIDGLRVLVPADHLDALAALPGVARLDADEPLAWHLDTSRPAVRIGPPVWTSGLRGEMSTVAVVDTGIDENHPGLQGKVTQALVFTGGSGPPTQTPTSTDVDGHGTHVAGIVAGTGQGSKLLDQGDRAYSGVAPEAELVSLDISPSFTTGTAIAAFQWIHDNHEAEGITVVQNSWGRKEVGQAFDPGDPAVRASDALVLDDGLLLIFSAANEGPAEASISMEAQNPNVLTVGAVDDAGRTASFSSRGPVPLQNGSVAPWTKPDVAAPGVQIKSAGAAAAVANRTDGLTYRELSGTSQAAPHVAGIAAILRAAAPDLDPLEVMEILRRTARDLGPAGPDPVTGHGVVDGADALELTLSSREGGLTLPTEETYTTSGELVLGPQQTGLAPEDTGVHVGQVTGEIPVKPNATTLSFQATWATSLAGTQTPGLTVTLTDPHGRSLLVPGQPGQANRTLTQPAHGTWTWRLQGQQTTSTGAVTYETTSTVVTPEPISLQGNFGGSGGFFESPEQRFQAWAEDLAAGELSAWLIAAATGVLALLLVVATVRLVR